MNKLIIPFLLFVQTLFAQTDYNKVHEFLYNHPPVAITETITDEGFILIVSSDENNKIKFDQTGSVYINDRFLFRDNSFMLYRYFLNTYLYDNKH